ncbi:MAG: DUF3343 domain-containing protein [Coriobacteriia bacterium]
MSELARFVVYGFSTTHAALTAEEILKAAGLQVVPIPAPARLGSVCGIALRVPRKRSDAADEALDAAGIEATGRFEIDDVIPDSNR